MNRFTLIGKIGIWLCGFSVGVFAFAILQADETHVRSSLPYFNPNPERKEITVTNEEFIHANEACRRFQQLKEERLRISAYLSILDSQRTLGRTQKELWFNNTVHDFSLPIPFELGEKLVRDHLQSIKDEMDSLQVMKPAQNENVYRAE